MQPRWSTTVSLVNPAGPPQVPLASDPVTGRPVEPAPVVTVGVPAVFAQRAVTNVGTTAELASESGGEQITSVAWADLLVPRGSPVGERTEVIHEATGARYRVVGQPALRPDYVAAACRFVSDLQEGSAAP